MRDIINFVDKNGKILKTILRKRWMWADGDYHIVYNGMWYTVKICQEIQIPGTKDKVDFILNFKRWVIQ